MVVEEEEKAPQTQLELFADSLPLKPYCTDDLETGLAIRPKTTAITRKIIQHNTPSKVRWLVFDCDYPDALGMIEAKNLPAPNLLVSNPSNGHAHVFYGLKVPVVRTDAARAKPLHYLACIEHALKDALEADFGYAGLVSKNPLHTHWRTTTHAPTCYELGNFAEYLTVPAKLPKRAQTAGLGRNCSIFEKARFIAYANVLKFKLEATQEAFADFILSTCQSINAGFPKPLEAKEVAGIAKSISKWTWKHFKSSLKSNEAWAKYVADTHTPELQRARQLKQVEKRQEATKTARQQAKEMKAGGSTQKAIAEALGVNQATISRWLKAD